MADVDFYKHEVERQQAKNAEYQRVWLEAIGLLSALAPNTVIDATDVPGLARRIFDRVHVLKNAYNASVAECMKRERALEELIAAANVTLSDAWIDLDDGCGEDCNEFSLYQSSCPTLVLYLKGRRKPLEQMTKDDIPLVFQANPEDIYAEAKRGEWLSKPSGDSE